MHPADSVRQRHERAVMAGNYDEARAIEARYPRTIRPTAVSWRWGREHANIAVEQVTGSVRERYRRPAEYTDDGHGCVEGGVADTLDGAL